MPKLAHIRIHPSQFPHTVQVELIRSFQERRVNPKFHYESLKQSRKWLALHERHSPARTDSSCAGIYEQSFAEFIPEVAATRVHVVGLGCGGGWKEARLLQQLRAAGKELCYTPSDVSVAMVLVAREAALEFLPESRCFPLVADLGTADDLAEAFQLSPALFGEHTRLFTCFGVLPNVEPGVIFPRLASLLSDRDLMLVSANLAPGPDYEQGLARVMPQYDNPETCDWLLTLLLDLGMETSDGHLEFRIDTDPQAGGLKQIAAWFVFSENRELPVGEEIVRFTRGDRLRLFFSYRYTPERLEAMLGQYGLSLRRQWCAPSREEGVFLVSRNCPRMPSAYPVPP